MQCMRWQCWPAPALLAVPTAAPAHNALHGPVRFDDIGMQKTPPIRRLWPVWEAARAVEASTLCRRPVTTFTFALNYAISGPDVTSYHVFNVLAHVTAGLALLGVARRTLAGF